MNKLFSSISFLFVLLACDSQTENNTNNKVVVKTISDNDTLRSLQLYAVDTIFNRYLPDTSLVFKDPDELRTYYFSSYGRFKDFCKKLKESSAKGNLIGLSVRQAEILYDDLSEVNTMKFYKTWKKDNRNMNMLGAFSPNSRIVSLRERIDFFKTFPAEIQNNEVGKRTWKKFMEYSFDRNINLDIHQFNSLAITDTNNKITSLESVFKSAHKYYILMFGASWCIPCRLEELQLKQWYDNIDKLQIKMVGLSIDRDYNKWKKYLKEDKFAWDCYVLQGEMNNTMIKQLQFQAVPRNFLIDETGKIIAENTDIRKILKAIPMLNTE